MQIQFTLFILYWNTFSGVQITFQYENDLLEELAFKSYEYDEDYLSNETANLAQPTVVNNIREKLLRMQNDYAKRMKIHEICYKKKLSDLQTSIMELNRQMEVSVIFLFFFEKVISSSLYKIKNDIFDWQAQKQLTTSDEVNKSKEDASARSTLKELVSQIHQLQQEVREKEMLTKRNEISFNFKVHATTNGNLFARDILSDLFLYLEWQFEPEDCTIRKIGGTGEATQYKLDDRDWILP